MVDSAVTVALGTALLAETAAILMVLVSIVRPAYRFWPPGRRSWRFWFIWGAWLTVLVALGFVAYHTAGTFVFTGAVWTAISVLLLSTGLSLWTWAGYTLRMQESLGLSGDLHTGGPYQFTRNPQNLGMFATVIGLLFLVNSFTFSVGALPVFIWLFLSPHAEEPWLRDTFGEEYDQYCETVPRFI